MQIVYADPFRAIRARVILKANGVASTLEANVPADPDPGSLRVSRIHMADADEAKAAQVLAGYDIMRAVVRKADS